MKRLIASIPTTSDSYRSAVREKARNISVDISGLLSLIRNSREEAGDPVEPIADEDMKVIREFAKIINRYS